MHLVGMYVFTAPHVLHGEWREEGVGCDVFSIYNMHPIRRKLGERGEIRETQSGYWTPAAEEGKWRWRKRKKCV